MIEFVSEKEAEEIDDSEKGEKDVCAEGVEKEKGEEKDDQDPVIVVRDIVVDKGKHSSTDSDDFSQGPIELSSLSSIQELKLANLALAKVSEDLLKSHIVDKELI